MVTLEPPKASPTVERMLKTARAVGQLTVLEGRSVGRKFKIDAIAILGRSVDAAIMLDDPEVSRQHARVVLAESGYLLEDLGSKNGTFLNGERIDRRRLSYGDKVRLGPHTVLEFSSFDVIEDHLVQRQRFEAIGRLGVGIAHDLNNVLAAMDAGAAYLSKLGPEVSLADSQVKECISDLASAAARGRELTRGILSFVRGRSSERLAVDVAALIQEVARMLRHTMDQSVRIEYDVGGHSVVQGSHSELYQIILNLCLNARDAMREGGTITISAEVVANSRELLRNAGREVLSLTVADTGTGMDPETQKRIFEPFFTTKRDGGGYGIGLATVKELVDLYGGKITLESTIGRGSRFSVYLPLLDVSSVRTSEAASAPITERPPAATTLLLVDDEQIVRRSIGRLLRHAGFGVTEAAHGGEAVQIYARKAHDLVLLDLDMPGLDGEQTQNLLLKLDPFVRIIFASGHADPQREAAVRARGALSFLQKPFTLETLVRIVNQALSPPSVFDPDELTNPSY